MLLARALHCQMQYGLGGPQEIRLEAFPRTYCEQFDQEIDASDSRPRRKPHCPSAPENPHAVYADNVTVGDIGREHGIGSHLDEFGDVQRNMLHSAAAA